MHMQSLHECCVHMQTSWGAFYRCKASPASPPPPGPASCEGPPEPWLQYGHVQQSGMARPTTGPVQRCLQGKSAEVWLPCVLPHLCSELV